MLEPYYPPCGRGPSDTLFLTPSSPLSWHREGRRACAAGINLPPSCFILKHLTKTPEIFPSKINRSPNSCDFGCQMFTHLGKCLFPCPVFSVSGPQGWTRSWTQDRGKTKLFYAPPFFIKHFFSSFGYIIYSTWIWKLLITHSIW